MTLKKERQPALDATRGLAILLMVLSGVIPYGTLPAWMYHAQIPPPDHSFNPSLPGFTWVDLVFPLFIFCLGVAIPVAFRSKEGSGIWNQLFYLVKRTFLLVAFAIIVQHLRPHQIQNSPDTSTWLLALSGFFLIFLCFSTYPKMLSPKGKILLRIISWVVLIAVLSQIVYKNGEGFSWYRSDIIILVLANVYFFGAIIYLLTKGKLIFKIAIALLLLALRIAYVNTEWVKQIEALNPLSWLFQLKFLQYLFITTPGIILGEMLLNRQYTTFQLSKNKKSLLAFICIALIINIIIFLQARYVFPMTLIVTSINLLVTYLLYKKNSATLIFQLYLMATVLLFIGFVAEPFEGGIKKDPSTLSYYFIASGLSCYVFLLLHLLKRKYYQFGMLNLMVNNGKNPMIAYVAFANLLWPILAVMGLEIWLLKITSTPWLGFLRGVAYTFVIAILVSFFTRKKLFWKT